MKQITEHIEWEIKNLRLENKLNDEQLEVYRLKRYQELIILYGCYIIEVLEIN